MMRCKALFFTLVFPAFLCAQNLVPNWSFEEYEECPDGMAQIEKATGWMSFRLSPDYYNACDLSEVVGVPHNGFTSYKEAIHGNSYAGFAQLTLPAGNREILGVELLEPLISGQEYYLSFYVSRGIVPTANCWANKIGVRFVNQTFEPWPIDQSIPILNIAQVFEIELVSDTVNWFKIEGNFIADSAYSYMAIGNHFDSDSVAMECEPQFDYSQAYYFVDCVCVSIDPLECPVCDTSTGDYQSIDGEMTSLIYPNPFSDHLSIEFPKPMTGQKEIELYGMEGKLISSHDILGGQVELTGLSNLSKGLYVLSIQFENGNKQYVKIIKN